MKWKIRCFFIRFRVAISPQSAAGPDAFVETRTFSRNHPRLGRCRFNCALLCLHRWFYTRLALECGWSVATALRFLTNQRQPQAFFSANRSRLRAESVLYFFCFDTCHKFFVFNGEGIIFEVFYLNLNLKKMLCRGFASLSCSSCKTCTQVENVNSFSVSLKL